MKNTAMAIRNEHPEKYDWWLSELESLGISPKTLNDLNDKREVSVRQGRVVEGEIGAIDEPVGVEQHQSFHVGECTRRRSSEPGTSGGVEPFVARRAAMRTSSRRAPMTSRPRPMGGAGSVGGKAVVRSARLAFVEVSVSE